MGARRDTRVEGDPAGVPSHHLDDEDPAVRCRCREHSIDRLRSDVDSSVETERDGGLVEALSIVFGTPITRSPASNNR